MHWSSCDGRRTIDATARRPRRGRPRASSRCTGSGSTPLRSPTGWCASSNCRSRGGGEGELPTCSDLTCSNEIWIERSRRHRRGQRRSFIEGLTVLTGETGAGKTMVVTSLHLLCGARADAGRVRPGAEPRRGGGPVRPARRARPGRAEVARFVRRRARRRRHRDRGPNRQRRRPLPRPPRWPVASRSACWPSSPSRRLPVHGQNDQLRLLRPASSATHSTGSPPTP